MKIKEIFDEIKNESSTKQKENILKKYKDNELLKKVLYLAESPRVKFYIKQIPSYNQAILTYDLNKALDALALLSSRHLTGHAGVTHLSSVLSLCETDDAYIIERIIDKDCKIGMGTTQINKVIKDLIEDTPYMGAKSFKQDLVKKLFEKGGKAFSQIKMDGRYCNSIISGGEVKLESRQGETTFVEGAEFLKELKNISNDFEIVLNGELTIDGVPRYESNGIISSIISIQKKLNNGEDASKDLKKLEAKHMPYNKALLSIRFTVWDVINHDEYVAAKSSTPYNERLDRLNKILSDANTKMVSVIKNKIVSSYDEAMADFVEAVTNNEEGTILKSTNGAWKDGKPNWQVKFKKEMNFDLRIVGFKYGTKGTKNEHVISTLITESEDGLLKTDPAGMDEDTMEYVTNNQEKLKGTIVEVKCSGISKDEKGNYSALHPVVKHFRDDKTKANTLKECIEIDKASTFL
jgi:ATP-dependent DNA ligase